MKYSEFLRVKKGKPHAVIITSPTKEDEQDAQDVFKNI
jgi:hypothetical protein